MSAHGAKPVGAIIRPEVDAPQVRGCGSFVVQHMPALITESLAPPERTKMSFTDVARLGSTSKDFRVCYARGETGMRTWEDVKSRKEIHRWRDFAGSHKRPNRVANLALHRCNETALSGGN